MSKNWSEEEIRESVRVYLKMRDLHDRGEEFTKKSYYEKLNESYGRTLKSYEYRMQNISYVLSLLGRNWIPGLNPKENVGTNVIEIIERSVQKFENSKNPPIAKFENEVRKIRKSKVIPLPSGSKTPHKSVTKSTSYSRDPHVVAWILKESEGQCECCDKPAPFNKSNRDFYLEVHHLKQLADNGTDTVSNALAVCPNCHRELHFGENKKKLLDDLYSKIDRLEKE